MKEPPASLQQKLADKLWHTLFGGGDSALLSPWQLRHQHKDHAQVRAAELAAIQAMLDELDDLDAGRKMFNTHGEIVPAPEDAGSSGIRLNPLIEQADEDPLSALRVPGTAEALRDIRREADILALRHSLNVRRIGLRAGSIAESVNIERFSERPVDADWLLRWKESAARAVAPDLQDLWARALVNEVIQPGTHSLRTLVFLTTLSRSEVEIVRIMSCLDLGGFVCREAVGYFNAAIHDPMFAQMSAMGLIEDGVTTITLPSASKEGFRVVLRSQAKALYIEGEDGPLKMYVRKFTRLGIEVLSLFSGKADTAYLFAVGNALKQRGFRVDIGDWFGQKGGGGLFSEKMTL